MPRGRPAGGPKSGGRQKGTPNKLSGDVKAMIRAALEEKGGVGYLVEQAEKNPTAFLTLVGKLVPSTVAGDPDNPIQLGGVFEIGFINPKKANLVP